MSSETRAGGNVTRPAGRLIHGGCHCGNIRFALDWPDKRDIIPARACGCSHCVKHGAAWTSNPGASFRLAIADPARVHVYRFGSKTADFHVCMTCGVVPIVTCAMEDRRFAVLNVRTFEGVASDELQIAPVSFEGEPVEDRLARRRRSWTPEAVS